MAMLLMGMVLAILLDQGLRGESFFRSLFLFPMAISFIVTGVVWRWLMNPAMGSRMSGLNLLFDKIGLDFLVNSWHTTPYLGGLRAVPDSIREAARVDGASEFKIYWLIILPLLRPVTLSAMIILGHISLKVFDLIMAVAGKQVALDVPSMYMWTTTFDGLFYSRGAAIGIMLLLAVTALVIPYLYYTLRSEAEV